MVSRGYPPSVRKTLRPNLVCIVVDIFDQMVMSVELFGKFSPRVEALCTQFNVKWCGGRTHEIEVFAAAATFFRNSLIQKHVQPWPQSPATTGQVWL